MTTGFEGYISGKGGGITVKKHVSHTIINLTGDFLLSNLCQDSAQGFGEMQLQENNKECTHFLCIIQPTSSHSGSLQSVKNRKRTGGCVIFPSYPNQQGLFLTGNCCKNQTLFLLRSAREGRKRRSEKNKGKKITRPHPWEQENIKNIQVKVHTQRSGGLFKRALGHKLRLNAERLQTSGLRGSPVSVTGCCFTKTSWKTGQLVRSWKHL